MARLTTQEVKVMLETGEELDFSNDDLRDINLNKLDLTGSIFTNADLSYADLSETDLTDAVFVNANLSHTNLRGANLTRANFDQANLWSVNLSKSRLKKQPLCRCQYVGRKHEFSGLPGI